METGNRQEMAAQSCYRGSNVMETGNRQEMAGQTSFYR